MIIMINIQLVPQPLNNNQIIKTSVTMSNIVLDNSTILIGLNLIRSTYILHCMPKSPVLPKNRGSVCKKKIKKFCVKLDNLILSSFNVKED